MSKATFNLNPWWSTSWPKSTAMLIFSPSFTVAGGIVCNVSCAFPSLFKWCNSEKKRGLTWVFNINFRCFSNHWVILTVTVSATFSGALAFNVSITATVCLDDCPCHYQSLLRVSHFYSRLSDTIITLAVIATLSVFVTVTLPAPSLSLSRTPRWSRPY